MAFDLGAIGIVARVKIVAIESVVDEAFGGRAIHCNQVSSAVAVGVLIRVVSGSLFAVTYQDTTWDLLWP